MDTDYVLKNPSIAEEREECIRRSVDAPIIPFFIDDVHTDIRKESVHILESTLLLTSHIDQFISMMGKGCVFPARAHNTCIKRNRYRYHRYI